MRPTIQTELGYRIEAQLPLELPKAASPKPSTPMASPRVIVSLIRPWLELYPFATGIKHYLRFCFGLEFCLCSG